VRLDDTWTYDGTDWTKHDVAVRPPQRDSQRLVWNATRRRLVMIGDANGAYDAWEWDGAAWSPLGSLDAAPDLNRVAYAPSFDGRGILAYGSHIDTGTLLPTGDELWELAWGDVLHGERCDGSDDDGDDRRGCADEDCWQACAPTCPPEASCEPGEPRCGDGICDVAHETCRTCTADCTCAAVCGDYICDPGETCPGDCP
jgi:hypothetical protein